MASHLKYLPEDVCVLFQDTNAEDTKQRLTDADTLLQFLLNREEEDWPYDLLDGLLDSGQASLAKTLLDEFQKLDHDDRLIKQPHGKRVRRKLQEAFTTRDQEMKLDDPAMLTFPTGITFKQYNTFFFFLIFLTLNLPKLIVNTIKDINKYLYC